GSACSDLCECSGLARPLRHRDRLHRGGLARSRQQRKNGLLAVFSAPLVAVCASSSAHLERAKPSIGSASTFYIPYWSIGTEVGQGDSSVYLRYARNSSRPGVTLDSREAPDRHRDAVSVARRASHHQIAGNADKP